MEEKTGQEIFNSLSPEAQKRLIKSQSKFVGSMQKLMGKKDAGFTSMEISSTHFDKTIEITKDKVNIKNK